MAARNPNGVILASFALAHLFTWNCTTSPAPSVLANLTGTWSGQAELGALETPLKMSLVDTNGEIAGVSGIKVDCRYYEYCGSFGDYTVTGSYDGSEVTLFGTSVYGESWTLIGTVRAYGRYISGTGRAGVSPNFVNFPWFMELLAES